MNIKDESIGVIPVYRNEKEDLYLIIKHKGDHWAFPKGHAEEGELIEQTARRELLEETDIKDIDIDLNTEFVEKYSFPRDGDVYDKTVTYFVGIVSTIDKEIAPDPTEEIEESRWVSFNEAQDILTHEEARTVLKEVKDYLN
ncbi:NUDIX domain-containing protein [Patescibacteria group bacterium]|nr:NUDIX domain-containing protein [Patescibacteria group bacterium]